MRAKIMLLLTVVVLATALQAGIPEPDMTLFGEVIVAGRPMGARNNVSIIARVSGDPDSLVGACRIGDSPVAGDYYVLRIRLESLADGSAQSSNAALVGQTVNIFVRISDHLEFFAGSVTITESGIAQYLNLYNGSMVFPDADVNTDGVVNFKDLARIAQCWDRRDCGTINDWCNAADIDHSTAVDFIDILTVANSWLQTASP